MFTSLFKNKDNSQKSSQKSMSYADEATVKATKNNEETAKEHGEDGVCCGGCGGE